MSFLILCINKLSGRRKTGRFRSWLALACLLSAALAAACAEGDGGSQATDGSRRVAVVTTSNIVADWVAIVGGGRVDVTALVPVGSDPHGYSPGARAAVRIAEADLLFTIGLGLEAEWLKDLVRNVAGGEAVVVELAPLADPLFTGATGVAGGPDDAGRDPHFWLDPLRVRLAVREISARLAILDPDGAPDYRDNADAYVSELEELHGWIDARVALLDQEGRKLVTSHDSLSYFADRYGFIIVGAATPGTSTDRDTTPRELADLIEAVEEQGVRAVFAETIEGGRLVEQLAREAGVVVVAGLFTGSLGGPDSGAETYLDMMRTNVELIVGALTPSP